METTPTFPAYVEGQILYRVEDSGMAARLVCRLDGLLRRRNYVHLTSPDGVEHYAIKSAAPTPSHPMTDLISDWFNKPPENPEPDLWTPADFIGPDALRKQGRKAGPSKVACMHKLCLECQGTGRKANGQACVHAISCPCPKCRPGVLGGGP